MCCPAAFARSDIFRVSCLLGCAAPVSSRPVPSDQWTLRVHLMTPGRYSASSADRMSAAAALEVACRHGADCCHGRARVDGAAVQATEEALAEVVRQRMEVRRLHNSVRARYHKLMQTASAAEIALFHSHNDGIRFIAWIFASIKVSPEPRACAAGSDHIEALLLAEIWQCALHVIAACAALLAQRLSSLRRQLCASSSASAEVAAMGRAHWRCVSTRRAVTSMSIDGFVDQFWSLCAGVRQGHGGGTHSAG